MERVRVLLVDDEDALRRLLGSYLTRQGYEVFACASGREVRELSNDMPFDVSVLDLGLPDVQGDELVRYLLTARPSLPILVSSGSPFDVRELGEAHSHRVRFLAKPYVPKALAEAIAQLLQA